MFYCGASNGSAPCPPASPASAWAARGHYASASAPLAFRAVVAVDAFVDCHDLYGLGYDLDEMYPSREHCRLDAAPLHVSPTLQPAGVWLSCGQARWYRGNDRLHEKLDALGVGHAFDSSPPTPDRVAKFVADILRRPVLKLM